MLISCPSCSTSFSVPDKALGANGRTLKCAKCGHKWFQAPPEPEPAEDDLDLDLDMEEPPLSARPSPRAVARAAEPDYEFEQPPIPDLGNRFDRSKRDEVPDLIDDGPQPVPEVFAQPADGGKKGTAGLWILLFLLLVGGLGGAAFYFQDKLVEAVPEAGEILSQAGLRREKPGAGLQLRSAGTPERFVHNETEVLIVRGVIANITDRARPVPTMKLVLVNKDKQVVQEKVTQPPVTALEPQGTASFKIMLERPDPNAVEVNVVFVEGETK
ncbi:MAG: zinc-ribbon domain-containing protein [Magnetospirillum sp.]|nr:zinc-ribbon domain-containing protein [Magnetospirillum sp.]